MALRMMDEGALRMIAHVFGVGTGSGITVGAIEPHIMIYTNVTASQLENTPGNVTATMASDAFTYTDFQQAQYPDNSYGSGAYATDYNLITNGITATYPKLTTAGSGGIAEIQWSPVTFKFTGALKDNRTVTGFIVYDFTSGDVFYAEALSTPVTPTTLDDTIIITPRFRMGNGTPF